MGERAVSSIDRPGIVAYYFACPFWGRRAAIIKATVYALVTPFFAVPKLKKKE